MHPDSSQNDAKKPRCAEPYVFDIYEEGSEWRWRLWSKNGKIVANGGETFKKLKRLVNFLQKLVPSAAVFVKGNRL